MVRGQDTVAGKVVDIRGRLHPDTRGEHDIGAQALAELADAELAMSRIDGGSDGEPLADRIRRWAGDLS